MFSGSTGILVLLHGQKIVCANVGDSRAGIYTVSEEGVSSMQMLSKDHTPGDETEKRRILAAGGKIMACKGSFGITKIFPAILSDL